MNHPHPAARPDRWTRHSLVPTLQHHSIIRAESSLLESGIGRRSPEIFAGTARCGKRQTIVDIGHLGVPPSMACVSACPRRTAGPRAVHADPAFRNHDIIPLSIWGWGTMTHDDEELPRADEHPSVYRHVIGTVMGPGLLL
jgi:hypothetical protein